MSFGYFTVPIPARQGGRSAKPIFRIDAQERLATHLPAPQSPQLRNFARSLKENHAASDELWQEAIEATLSYANKAG
jgi:hypothetical protein